MRAYKNNGSSTAYFHNRLFNKYARGVANALRFPTMIFNKNKRDVISYRIEVPLHVQLNKWYQSVLTSINIVNAWNRRFSSTQKQTIPPLNSNYSQPGSHRIMASYGDPGIQRERQLVVPQTATVDKNIPANNKLFNNIYSPIINRLRSSYNALQSSFHILQNYHHSRTNLSQARVFTVPQPLPASGNEDSQLEINYLKSHVDEVLRKDKRYTVSQIGRTGKNGNIMNRRTTLFKALNTTAIKDMRVTVSNTEHPPHTYLNPTNSKAEINTPTVGMQFQLSNKNDFSVAAGSQSYALPNTDELVFEHKTRVRRDMEEIKNTVAKTKHTIEELNKSYASAIKAANNQVKDVGQIADEVYRDIEQRIRWERERRGL
jgi:hypothetical protein